ncbi:hypothetical protein ACIHCQ_29570 [Streptomyces sp. NPDC052236]
MSETDARVWWDEFSSIARELPKAAAPPDTPTPPGGGRILPRLGAGSYCS